MAEAGTTSNPWEIIKAIKMDVGRTSNKLARKISEIALEDLTEAHREIMKSYYGGYTPVGHQYYDYTNKKTGKVYSKTKRGYRRTYNFMYNSRLPVGVVPSGKHSFKAVMSVGSEKMHDYVNPYKRNKTPFPAEAVFDMIWNQGIRGLPPGYLGHIGEVDVGDASAFGIDMSSSIHKVTYPDDAMNEFVQHWGDERGKIVAEMAEKSI